MAKILPKRSVVIVGGGLTAGAGRAPAECKDGVDTVVLERGGDHRGGAEARRAHAKGRAALGGADPVDAELGDRDLHAAALTGRACAAGPQHAGVSSRRRHGRRGKSLEWPDLALGGIRPGAAHALDGALRREGDSREHADSGLGRHLRGDGALSRSVRAPVRHRGQGGKRERTDPAGRQSVRGAPARRVSAAAARDHRGGTDLRARGASRSA